MKKVDLEKIFFIGLGVYFLLHFAFRLLISNALEKDEAEMILFFQQGFKLGYNSQPPLYYWLQFSLFKISGLNIFSLVILKNSLFFTFYFFLYKSAKIILKRPVLAIFSTISLILVYNFSWIMHKDLTHSVLLLSICSLTFFTFLKVLKTRKIVYYIFLGICIGLGLITKYNYFLFFLPLFLSCLFIEKFRHIIFSKKSLYIVLLIGIISAPHFFWCYENTDLLLSDIGDFKLNDTGFTFGTKGVLDLLENVFLLVIPLAVIFAFFFPKAFCRYKHDKNNKNDFKLYLELFFLISFILTLLVIIGFDVGQAKPRWIQPLFFLFPLYFFIRVSRLDLKRKKISFFLILVFICALGTIFSVWGRIFFAEARGRYNRLNFPFPQISEKIKKEESFSRGLILAEDNVLGANLKLTFSDSFIVTPLSHQFMKPKNNFDKILIIWEPKWYIKFTPLGMNDIFSDYQLNLQNESIIKKRAFYKYSNKDYYELELMVLDKI